MSLGKLSWGKGTVKFGTSTGAEASVFETMPAIVEKSANLVTNQGAVLEARQQGGGLIDRREGDPTFVFSFEIYHQTGQALPIEAPKGSVATNKSLVFIPENPAAWGFKLPYCQVSVENRWDEDKGSTILYTFTALELTSGEIFEWVSGPVVVSPTTLSFVAAGESKTAAVISPGSATVSSDQGWLTASIVGATITATAASNSGAARTATITVTQGTESTTITVTQAAA